MSSSSKEPQGWTEGRRNLRTYTEEQRNRKNSYGKEYYQRNKDRIAEYGKEYRKANPEKGAIRAKKYWENNKYKCEMARIKKIFGLSQQDYEQLLFSQQGLCCICNTQLENLNIDHCHTTGKIRGLLCKECNLALGLFKDNPTSLRKAALYIEEYNHE